MIFLDDELLQEYVTECREHLSEIESQLLALEEGGAQVDEELVNKVFRAAHSIKGGAGLLDLRKLKELSHRTENVLGLIRSRELTPTPEVVNILLLAFDRIRYLVNDLKSSDDADISDVAVALTGLSSSSLPSDRKSSLTHQVEVRDPDSKARTSVRASSFDLDRAKRSAQNVYLVEYDLEKMRSGSPQSPLDVLGSLGEHGTILDCTVVQDAAGETGTRPSSLHVLFATGIDEARIHRASAVPARKIRQVEGEHGRDPTPAVAPAPLGELPRIDVSVGLPDEVVASHDPSFSGPPSSARTATLPGLPAGSTEPEPRATTLRVNVALLESLMNLAGDLVLSRNQLNDAIARGDLDAIQASSQRMSGVTSDLQLAIVQTRLQPVGNLLSRFRRMVRDLGHELGKEIQLNIVGSDVEMDKAIIEGLNEPLTHMVRNAADHGIESPEERRRLGKPPAGLIEIRAQHEAGQVVVEVRDDGRGLDSAAIVNAALERRAVTPEQVAHMSASELLALIFLPGVSTVARVTDLSGRGVGMDVVKSNLDRLSGKIDIETVLGTGTVFRFTLPLTLAIIPSLLVSVGPERFAIPQTNLVELLRIPASMAKERFEFVGDAEVLMLRGELIPVVHLGDVLGIERFFTDPRTGLRRVDRRARVADRRSPRYECESEIPAEPGSSSQLESANRRAEVDRRYHAASDINVAIVSAGNFRYGLVVELLYDTLEIVVKPLGKHLTRLREYAGATILGDGAVALILDVNGLAGKAGLASLAESTRARQLASASQRTRLAESISLLLFRNSPREQCAVPLAQVTRVERIEGTAIETLGGRRTVRYRGTSLPLVTLHDVAAVDPMEPAQERGVIVFEVNRRDVGLLVALPVDAVDVAAMVDRETHRQRGILGSMQVKNETTLIVDLMDLVETIYPEWTADRRVGLTDGGSAGTVVLAEDSDFLRGHVRKYIESGGYTVLLAEDGQAGWELLEEHAGKVDLLVTDIEMPRLSGLQLTRRLRGDDRFRKLPVVALSSLAGEDDMLRGVAAGVTEYLVKLDGEKLLETIRRLLEGSALARAY